MKGVSSKPGTVIGLVLLFISTTYVSQFTVVHTDRTTKPEATFDMAVVLAGSYTDRSVAAAELYKKDVVNRVLLTDDGVRMGWSRRHQRNLYAIERSEIMLRQRGVPASVIVKLPFCRSGTVYDALAVRGYLQANPARRILLVTSDYHADRALWIFNKVLTGMPVSVDVTTVPSGWGSVVPILMEPLKSVYYWVRFGWLAELPEMTK